MDVLSFHLQDSYLTTTTYDHNPACSTGGFYNAPKMDDTVDSLNHPGPVLPQQHRHRHLPLLPAPPFHALPLDGRCPRTRNTHRNTYAKMWNATSSQSLKSLLSCPNSQDGLFSLLPIPPLPQARQSLQTPDEIWVTLKANNVHLEGVHANGICVAFLDLHLVMFRVTATKAGTL